MQLTEHFSLEALIASESAIRFGIDNTPPEILIPNVRRLAISLERVQMVLDGKAIHVLSGYRCKELNQRIGGSKHSMHMQGLAADIICPRFGSPLEVCRAIAAANLGVDQIIHEFGKWCHVGWALTGATSRNELLTIAKAETGYEAGLRTV